MSIHGYFVRYLASEDQRLQLFKEYYLQCTSSQRTKLYRFIRAVADLSPTENDEAVKFAQDIGCQNNCILDVSVTCELLEEFRSASVSPNLLLQAIRAWNRGEEFTPPALAE